MNPTESTKPVLTAADEVERAALDFVTKWMKDADELDEPRMTQIRKNRALYEADNQTGRSSDANKRADLRDPYAFIAVETIKPMLVDALFGEEPYVDVKGLTAEDDEEAESIRDFIQNEFEKARLRRKWIDVEHMRCVDGTVVLAVPYTQRKQQLSEERMKLDEIGQPILNQQTGEPEMETVTYWVTEKECAEPEIIEPFHVFRDVRAKDTDIRTHRGFAYGFYRTFDELRDSPLKYKNMDALSRAISEDMQPKANFHEVADGDVKKVDASRTKKGQVYCVSYWGLFCHDQKAEMGKRVYEESIITVCPEYSLVIRVDKANRTFKRPFRPFVAIPFIPRPNHFWGISVVEKAENLIKESEAIKNARLDILTARLNPPWLASRHAGINLRSLRFEKNKIILTDDMDGVRTLPVPEPPSALYRDLAEIEYGIQNTTGVINASQSVSNVGQAFGKTATGIGMFQSMMGNRIGAAVAIAEADGLVPLAEIFFKWAFEYQDETKAIVYRTQNRIPQWITKDPAILTRRVDFIPVGANRRITKSQHTAILDRFLTMLMNVEQSRPMTIKWDPLIPDIMQNMGYMNAFKYVFSDKERNAIQQQNAEQAKHDDIEKTAFNKHLDMMAEQQRQERQTNQMIDTKIAAAQADAVYKRGTNGNSGGQ